MFACEKLIYIQMPKTGCTHVASLLSRLFDGRQIGKHNVASDSQIEAQDYFVSSIRNPWEWYLSLWTFGVQGNGGVNNRLTRDRELLQNLIDTARNPSKMRFTFFNELSRDVKRWRKVYERDDCVESFRKWLQMIHNPRNRHSLGEGYGSTALPELCGFMTYRYLRLCCKNRELLRNPKLITQYKDIIEFDNQNCYIDTFIRQESLESSLCEAIERVRPLTREERDLIFGAAKKNSSNRPLTISEYYDRKSVELVWNRDRLLVEKFGYSPPRTLIS